MPRSRIELDYGSDPEDDNAALHPPTRVTQSKNLLEVVQQIQFGKDLSDEQAQVLRRVVLNYSPILEEPTPASVPKEIAEHRIVFRDDVFISTRPFRCGEAQLELLRKHVDELLKAGMIRRSSSPHSSAIFAIPKKNGELRWVVDFRQVNANTIPDKYPIPSIEDILPRTRDANIFSRIDLKSAYWQVGIRKEDQEKTAFTVPFGLFEWTVLAFGLKNAPACFQRLIDRVLTDCREFSLGYFDDILVYSKNLEAHVCHLREVFQRLAKFGLRINPKKCLLAAVEVLFLGYTISHGRLSPDPSKVQCVKEYPIPRSVKEVQRFLGLVGFYRRWIRRFSELAAPLTQLTKKGVLFRWTEEHRRAFEELRGRLCKAPILVLPDYKRLFILETDASVTGIGGVLTQQFSEGKLPIAYASRRLTTAETRYPTRELEALSILFCCKRLSHYLKGRHFRVVTDHESLTWLTQWKSPSPRIRRWLAQLQEYSFEAVYQPGKANVVADALSRIFTFKFEERIEFPAEAEWAQAYAEDPVYGPFIAFLEGAEAPAEKRVKFERMAQLFKREGPILYKKKPGSLSEKGVIIIPERFRHLFLMSFHDLPTGGHFGSDKMFRTMLKRFEWPGMKAEIAAYVRGCLQCALARTRKPPRIALTLFDELVPDPFAMIHVDHITNLPRTPRGHEAILVIVDRCTAWVELKPVRSLSAQEAAVAIMERVIYRHGTPKTIISDNGGAFVSQLFAELAQHCGFKPRLTSAYNPQSNGFVERRNACIKKLLRVFVSAVRAWDESLGAIEYALRTTPLDRLPYTPAFLLYGRELLTPIDAMLSGEGEADGLLQVRDQWILSKLRTLKQARRMVAEEQHRMRQQRAQREAEVFGWSRGSLG
jgi:hypothetical protein